VLLPPSCASNGASESPAQPSVEAPATADEWALWTQGTQLRGANIYQRRVYAELDGTDYFGPGPLGPPYTQNDIDRLAALGANYVNISHTGLYTETPPYRLDSAVMDNLSHLLGMIGAADMFAVVTFRTGPGRNEFAIFPEELGSWYPGHLLVNTMWEDEAAQRAWVEMWREAAARLRNHEVVVGYDLMCEPNPDDSLLGIWEPAAFYPTYANTLYDWNPLQAQIAVAIREVDSETPILVGGMGYSAVAWLPYVAPSGVPRVVYTVHQYAPHEYTHQWPGENVSYPGRLHGTDFDRGWLNGLLGTVDRFSAGHGAPVAVNEYGVQRWAPGGAQFMTDLMDLFEERGMNHALWNWASSWAPQADNDAFNFLHGPDPAVHFEVGSTPLLRAITANWALNSVRPSSFGSTVPHDH
jgi:hypothetical protein